MKIFLTGATGHIGSPVAEKLQAAGHTVLGLARSDEAVAKLQDAGVEPLRGDLRDLECLVRGAQAADAVIHTGFVRDVDYSEAINDDRNATNAMLGTLEDSGKPFIYTSSLFGTGDHVVDEDTPFEPPPFMVWRADREQEVLQAVARGVRSLVIRPGFVYGRGWRKSGGDVIFRLVQTARQGEVAFYIGTGENKVSTVHVDDLADVYVRALEHAPTGILFNISAGSAVSMKAIAEAISRNIGAGGKTESWSVEEARSVFGPAAEAFTLSMQVSGTKAAQLLGWVPQAPCVLEDIEHGSYRH